MAITYLIGDATTPDGRGPGVIAHVCNDSGGGGKGFVLAVSRRWAEPEAAYRRWARSGQEFGLGMVQLVTVDDHLRVANMVAQHGNASRASPVAIRYDALAQCLSKLAGRIDRGTVTHMPRIGCGLAGGTWDQVEPLLDEHPAAAGFDVRVYDLPPHNTRPRTCSNPGVRGQASPFCPSTATRPPSGCPDHVGSPLGAADLLSESVISGDRVGSRLAAFPECLPAVPR